MVSKESMHSIKMLNFDDGFDSKALCKYVPKILGNVKDWIKKWKKEHIIIMVVKIVKIHVGLGFKDWGWREAKVLRFRNWLGFKA